MSAQEKTIQVSCTNPECKMSFHIRLSLEDQNAEGSGDIWVDCMRCGESVMITVDRKYIEKNYILRKDG